jgi:pathogen-inducible salicylic acid glucosyltransferase
MAKIWPLRMIYRTLRPTIPFMFLDKRLDDDKDCGLNIFKPMNTDAWMKWLNDRAKGSAVYVSFGSMAAFEVEQMEELAWELRMSDNYLILSGGQCIRRNKLNSPYPQNKTMGSLPNYLTFPPL